MENNKKKQLEFNDNIEKICWIAEFTYEVKTAKFLGNKKIRRNKTFL